MNTKENVKELKENVKCLWKNTAPNFIYFFNVFTSVKIFESCLILEHNFFPTFLLVERCLEVIYALYSKNFCA